MRRIFSKLLYEIEEERSVMLVTVVADRGSAPRGAGAAMLVGEKGRITGSIGGGAETFFGKNRGRSIDGLLRRLTIIGAGCLAVTTLILIMIQ